MADDSDAVLAELEHELAALYLNAERVVARQHSQDGTRSLEKLSLHVLGRLAAEGPLRPSALAQLVRLDLSTVSRHIASLEHEGLLAREPDPTDRRAFLVAVTPSGAAALAVVEARRRRRLEQVLADFSPADRSELTRLLGRFNAAVVRLESRTA